MNEIMIFTAGVSLGALVVCFSVCAAIVASGGLMRNPQRDVSATLEGNAEEEENERIKKQFENLFNYNGTTEGQTEIGDE